MANRNGTDPPKSEKSGSNLKGVLPKSAGGPKRNPKGFDAGDNNFFRYCGNDPMDRVDPMGTEYGASTDAHALRISTMDKIYVEPFGQDQDKIEIRREVAGSPIPQMVATITAARGALAAAVNGVNLSMGYVSGITGKEVSLAGTGKPIEE